jgi:hypothetical protein
MPAVLAAVTISEEERAVETQECFGRRQPAVR